MMGEQVEKQFWFDRRRELALRPQARGYRLDSFHFTINPMQMVFDLVRTNGINRAVIKVALLISQCLFESVPRPST